MDPAKEINKDGLCKALHPSILTVCDTLSKYSCWLMTLLMTTAFLLWLMKSLYKEEEVTEATVIYSSSTVLAESEASTDEEVCKRSSPTRIPVRDNNAFRIRQMYAAMKMGKPSPLSQKTYYSKRK